LAKKNQFKVTPLPSQHHLTLKYNGLLALMSLVISEINQTADPVGPTEPPKPSTTEPALKMELNTYYPLPIPLDAAVSSLASQWDAMVVK